MMSMCNGTQYICKQMAINFLIKMSVRDEALDLIKNNNLPKPVVGLLSKLLHLPTTSPSTWLPWQYRFFHGFLNQGIGKTGSAYWFYIACLRVEQRFLKTSILNHFEKQA